MRNNVDTGMNFERCNVYISPSTNISEIRFDNKKSFESKAFKKKTQRTALLSRVCELCGVILTI